MSDAALLASVAKDAERVAAGAADKAEVTIRPLTTIEELQRLIELFAAVWRPRHGRALVPLELAQSLRYSGNYVVAAFAAEGNHDMVGGSVGFFGEHAGRRHLHSHVTGVLPEVQHRSVGYAIKVHQRAWSLAAGLDQVIWTFDPLIRRNAYFNLAKLGARVVGYEECFYGDALADDINAGDESDRAVILWSVASPEVADTLNGRAPAPPTGGATVLDQAEDGTPVERDVPAGGVERAWVPPDIVSLRQTDPGLARAWRRALRHTVGRAVLEGYVGVAMSRDGWYTLVPRRP